MTILSYNDKDKRRRPEDAVIETKMQKIVRDMKLMYITRRLFSDMKLKVKEEKLSLKYTF